MFVITLSVIFLEVVCSKFDCERRILPKSFWLLQPALGESLGDSDESSLSLSSAETAESLGAAAASLTSGAVPDPVMLSALIGFDLLFLTSVLCLASSPESSEVVLHNDLLLLVDSIRIEDFEQSSFLPVGTQTQF